MVAPGAISTPERIGGTPSDRELKPPKHITDHVEAASEWAATVPTSVDVYKYSHPGPFDGEVIIDGGAAGDTYIFQYRVYEWVDARWERNDELIDEVLGRRPRDHKPPSHHHEFSFPRRIEINEISERYRVRVRVVKQGTNNGAEDYFIAEPRS